MNGIAQVTILGNLTRDPELKYTPKGTAVCQVGVAVNTSFQGQDGQKVEKVSFIDCVLWKGAAETLAKYLTKGSPVFLTGRLEQETWEDKQTGDKKSRLKVQVQEFRFVGGKREGDGEGQPARPPSRPAARPSASDDGPPLEDDDVPF